jgi:anti-sigma factor RsiW
MKHSPVTEADLHAYIDGVLPQARHLEVEIYLATRPQEVQRLLAYREAGAELRKLFNPVLDEPIPERLLATARRRGAWPLRHAAVAALVVASTAAGWFAHANLHPAATPQDMAVLHDEIGLARQAAIAHAVYSPEVRHPVEVGAEQREHLMTWLSKRIGVRFVVPQLDAIGYTLVGGRLLPGVNGPAAQLMYHDALGKRLTLYISPEYTQAGGGKANGFQFAQENRLNVLYWIDERFGCALSGDLPDRELARIGHAIYEQLEKQS